MKAGLRYNFGGLHLRIQRIAQSQKNLGNNRRTSCSSDCHHYMVIFHYKSRAHAGKWTLPGGDGVRFTSHQFEMIRYPRGHGKVVHLIVKQNAGSGDHHLRTKGGVDRDRARDPVAFGVGDAEVGGVFFEAVVLPVGRRTVLHGRCSL